MNRKKYVINFLISMILVSSYICFRINLGTLSDRLFIQRLWRRVCLGFGRANDLYKHAPACHRFPLSVWPANVQRIAIKAVVARGAAGRCGGWSGHNEKGCHVVRWSGLSRSGSSTRGGDHARS
jgi:hypothetical protein